MKYKLHKIYMSNLGRLYFVDEKQNAIVVYSASVSMIVEKGVNRIDGQSPEETVEMFLNKTCHVDLDRNA